MKHIDKSLVDKVLKYLFIFLALSMNLLGIAAIYISGFDVFIYPSLKRFFLFFGVIFLINGIGMFSLILEKYFFEDNRFLSFIWKISGIIMKTIINIYQVVKGILLPFAVIFMIFGIPFFLLIILKINWFEDFLSLELIYYLSFTLTAILSSFFINGIYKKLFNPNLFYPKDEEIIDDIEIARNIATKYLYQDRLKFFVFILYFISLSFISILELSKFGNIEIQSLAKLSLLSLGTFIAFDRIMINKHLFYPKN